MEGVGQFVVFCGVGGLNTVVDFLAINALSRRPFQWRRIPANIGSTTAAMANSYVINSLVVFDGGQAVIPELGRFLGVTLVSAYGVQSAVIYLLSYVWPQPVSLLEVLVRRCGMTRLESETIQRNLVKVAAVGVGILWNFFFYKYFAFRS